MPSAYLTEKHREMLTSVVTAVQFDLMQRFKLTETQAMQEVANTLMHVSIGTFQQIAVKERFQEINNVPRN